MSVNGWMYIAYTLTWGIISFNKWLITMVSCSKAPSAAPKHWINVSIICPNVKTVDVFCFRISVLLGKLVKKKNKNFRGPKKCFSGQWAVSFCECISQELTPTHNSPKRKVVGGPLWNQTGEFFMNCYKLRVGSKIYLDSHPRNWTYPKMMAWKRYCRLQTWRHFGYPYWMSGV